MRVCQFFTVYIFNKIWKNAPYYKQISIKIQNDWKSALRSSVSRTKCRILLVPRYAQTYVLQSRNREILLQYSQQKKATGLRLIPPQTCLYTFKIYDLLWRYTFQFAKSVKSNNMQDAKRCTQYLQCCIHHLRQLQGDTQSHRCCFRFPVAL